jgi:hypothetical protein
LREFLTAGIVADHNGAWVWYTEHSHVLRWKIPSGESLPTFESHAAFDLVRVLADPTGKGWLALDRSGAVHLLPSP